MAQIPMLGSMKNMDLQLRDLKFGLKLNRRVFMIGGAAAISTASRILTAAPRCVLTPEQEEGPYYVDFGKARRDVTEGKTGVPLQLRVALVDAKRCEPLEAAAVDIWHCDATGIYSGFTANGGGDDAGRGYGRGRGGPGGPGGRGGGRGEGPIDETRFLRGIQITNRQGIAEFATVYPGWYAGRTIHIHLKVHLGGSAGAERYAGGHVSHTGQLFLPEDITEGSLCETFECAPDAAQRGQHFPSAGWRAIHAGSGATAEGFQFRRVCRGRRPRRGSGSNARCILRHRLTNFYKQAGHPFV
jgi:protocatechuate 3,4-dioxygenase beta subunit